MISNIVQILRKKKFSLYKLSKKNNNFLMKNGYLLLKPKKKYWQWIGANPKEIRTIIDRLIRKEGLKAGSEGKEKFTYKRGKKIEESATRLGNLLDKHPIFRKIATLPEILWLAKNLIKDEIKLSSILFRQPNKNSGNQDLHIDWFPRVKRQDKFHSLIAFLYLENANKKNGATKLVPKSHLRLGYPNYHLNVKDSHQIEKTIIAKTGSILILNANTWHRGGNNHKGEKRGIVVIEYRRRKYKQLLNMKKYLRPKTVSSLNEYEKYLFGVRKKDKNQKIKSFGPGNQYRRWLKRNPKYEYQNLVV